jgi:hypothetical protein
MIQKILFLSFIIVGFHTFSQDDQEDELDDEYKERSYDEIEEERGHKKVWTWHPAPATYKGNLSYENYSQNQIAIMGDGKILVLEKVSDDVEIVGQWFDYYIVFTESTNKLVVKGRTGNQISTMIVPDNCDIIGLFKDGMTDYEIMYTTHAFDIENMETGQVKRYDKFCKLKYVK